MGSDRKLLSHPIKEAVGSVDGIREQLAIGLLHETHDFFELTADGLRHVHGEQLLGRGVQIDEIAVEIGRDDGLAQRLQRGDLHRRRRGRRCGQRRRDECGTRDRLLFLDLAAREGPQFARRDHLDTRDQQRGRALEVDRRGS